MTELLSWLVNCVSYDAERDFYAKHFPSVAAMRNRAHFRPMQRSDVGAIVAIEQQVYDFPWSKGTFRDCMKISSYTCWVCERGDEILAYGILSVGGGESHVMNLCVSPHVQRRGFGLKMLNKLMDVAREHRVDTMLLEVRPSNEPALTMYRNIGFNEIGVRKGYYPAKSGREDALVLAITLAADEEPGDA